MTRTHILAWLKPLEHRNLLPVMIRRKLLALSGLLNRLPELNVTAIVTKAIELALLIAGDTKSAMPEQPLIETARLFLRYWRMEDTAALQRLAGKRKIADTMISIPHPFTEQQAALWIAGHSEIITGRKSTHFAIDLKGTDSLVGAVGLWSVEIEHSRAELSYWIGVEWWGQGFATEAASTVVRYGFEQLNLNRLQAFHMVRNPASGRVLGKIGMKREGLARHCVRKWDRFEDVEMMAILREDWATTNKLSQSVEEP